MISDRLVIEFDKALRTLFAPSPTNRRFRAATNRKRRCQTRSERMPAR
jgi:hypothetical protein